MRYRTKSVWICDPIRVQHPWLQVSEVQLQSMAENNTFSYVCRWCFCFGPAESPCGLSLMQDCGIRNEVPNLDMGIQIWIWGSTSGYGIHIQIWISISRFAIANPDSECHIQIRKFISRYEAPYPDLDFHIQICDSISTTRKRRKTYCFLPWIEVGLR